MKTPKIIAHRGFWKSLEISENSLESLISAQTLPIYGSEFDVRMSKDEVLVIQHDSSIFDLEISETNFDELNMEALKKNFKLSTLEEFLIQGKKNPDIKLVIEIKDLVDSEMEFKTADKVLKLIKKKQHSKSSRIYIFQSCYL